MFTYTRDAVQIVLALIFLQSSVSKSRHFSTFRRGVTEYHVLPAKADTLFALAVPPIEFILAVAHGTGQYVNLAAQVGIALLMSFSVAVAVNLRRSRLIPCYGGVHGFAMAKGHVANPKS
jgi:hypothetical protein